MYLLVPWIFDVTIAQICTTMLPFFIIYITNPYNYCIKNNIPLSNNKCSSTFWLAILISMFIIGCTISLFLWHTLLKFVQRKKGWQGYSLFSVFSFSLFMAIGEGDMSLLIILSLVNSIPVGGSYLNEVFTTDIIDYDEFITGKRNEGLYVVFNVFVPKIVTVFAQSVPLAFMYCK
jgi:Na+/melibiose symporter-like transporter